MPYANAEDRRARRRSYIPENYKAKRKYDYEYYLAHMEKIRARARKWYQDNRERRNSLCYLNQLRKIENPTPQQVKKMAEIAAKYPKKRIQYV